MTVDAMQTVTVQLLGKEYKLSCPADERAGLMRAAQLLDEHMKRVKNSSASVIGLERIAVMAALNLSFELLQAQERASVGVANQARLDRLLAQADEELAAFEQVATERPRT